MCYPVGAATVGRKGEVISPMAELKDAGVVAFSDDGVAIKTASILKRSLEYAKCLIFQLLSIAKMNRLPAVQ